MEQEKIIKRILKRNLIADFIEVYSLLICLVPIVLIFVIQSNIWVSTVILSVFFRHNTEKQLVKSLESLANKGIDESFVKRVS